LKNAVAGNLVVALVSALPYMIRVTALRSAQIQVTRILTTVVLTHPQQRVHQGKELLNLQFSQVITGIKNSLYTENHDFNLILSKIFLHA
jgi:hypothetical protein